MDMIKELIGRRSGFTNRFAKFQDFHNLMQFRIRRILLVSSLYDSYIFEEDGRLYELLREEYHHLNLSHSPELIQFSSGKEAINYALKDEHVDLIIATQHISDIHVSKFGKQARKAGVKVPLILLGYDNIEMAELLRHPGINYYDRVFYWLGDYRVIIGIVKYLEDKYNVEPDTNLVGVQTIILVEDNIRFYSSYLPMIYSELLRQSQSLLDEGINLTHKFLRMRARPKILLTTNYEEAIAFYKKYKDTLLGVISDIDFYRKGKKDPKAGLKLARRIKKENPDIPFLLQSSNKEVAEKAYELGASFIWKKSPALLHELRDFMHTQFSFGDFIFRDKNGKELDRARNLAELEEKLRTIPAESIRYHALRNHFSTWLKARTEFWLADLLRPQRVSDFNSAEEIREMLIREINNFRISRQRGVILDFNKESFLQHSTIARIGNGSLGGKARGIGFMNRLLNNFDLWDYFDNTEVFIPSAVILATDIFDQFLEQNNLLDFALKCEDDNELYNRFNAALHFPDEAVSQLYAFLEVMTTPLSVRSSSLLEDSQGQPFAGVYETLMFPNSHPDINVRLVRLVSMIKRIYASVFAKAARDYMSMTAYRLEEEKMAVVIQEVVGKAHNGRFYPDFSGVAKSYNFYPVFPYTDCKKIASVGFGLGKIIVDGEKSFTFCPEYPNKNSFATDVQSILDGMQRIFYAVDLNVKDSIFDTTNLDSVRPFDISVAEKDGTLNYVASTYSPENDAIYDGTSRPGLRIFSLAPMLKYKTFPIAEILNGILEVGTWGMGAPVEIEFAVNLRRTNEAKNEFALLQMRPLVVDYEKEELNLKGYKENDLLCKSENALGNGIIRGIKDIVYVKLGSFNRAKTADIARELDKLNSKLTARKKKYILIALGRIGTKDPWLGIPVTWEQISGARTIVESNFQDMYVEPSQGSHFFHNLTSFKVGYFTVDPFRNRGFLNWDWLDKLAKRRDMKYVAHVELDEPLTVKINGRTNEGVILKPGVE